MRNLILYPFVVLGFTLSSFHATASSLPADSSHKEFNLVEQLRGEHLPLPLLLNSLAKTNLTLVTPSAADIILTGRQLKTIIEAHEPKQCSTPKATWQEVLLFASGGITHKANLLISSDCHKIDVKHLFLGESIASPEMFYDIAFPAIHMRLQDQQRLKILAANREEFLKEVTFHIRPISEAASGIIQEEWQVFYKDKPYSIMVEFTPLEDGRYTFTII